MAEWVLRYADDRGQIHQKSVEGANEHDIRQRYSSQGFLVYSVRPRDALAGVTSRFGSRRKKVDLEKFLIFNQQFVTLIKAGLPILKALDLLADKLTDPKLSVFIRNVRDDVRTGTLLSEAFSKQAVFSPVYVTSVMAGEKSGALVEVLERYITFQRLALAARKKLLLSLMYPSILVFLVICLIVFLVTYVVPSFAELYTGIGAELPAATQFLIAIGTTARNYVLLGFVALVGGIIGLRIWMQRPSAQLAVDRVRLRTPILGEIWVKFQVAQFARVLSTLMVGGIPLVNAIETASEAIGSALLKQSLDKARKSVREGQSLANSMLATGVFPPLAIDMVEVGESTGALAAMLNSVAEFFEDDVQTRLTAVLSLIEPAIMIFMGIFVAFVLIALYLPIFSLADTMR